MSERAGPDRSDRERDPLRTRLDGLVSRTRAALWWEAAWPVIWRAIGVILFFLAFSWLGLWLDLPIWARMMGVGAFAVSLIAALWPLVTLKPPGRAAALARLDREAGLKHGPARALEDQLALGGSDPGTRALWELHRRRAEAAVGGLRSARPSPGMPLHDRYAARAALLVVAVASAFYAGPELGSRLGSAFAWRAPQAAAPAFRVDGWIDPPLYTRSPPLMIDFASGAGEHRLRAPVRSTVVIRMAGKGDASVTAGPGLVPVPNQGAARPDLKEERFTLERGGELTLRTGFASSTRLVIETIPDLPPEIALAGPPEVNARGTFTLAYRAKDDYGVAAAEGLVEKTGPGAARRSLAPAPKIPLATPSDPASNEETRAPVDLTQHPWAGARVRLTLVARDEAGQEGRSEPVEIALPQRPFTKPLARALVEQRRNLVLDPDDRRRVQTALDALLIEPGTYTKEWGVFLGLRTAAERLRRARSDAQLNEVAEWLWAMALQIEDGGLSDAERELRAAQERLREAMDRNAPDDEVRKLTEELRQAMDKFLREFAERMQREQQRQQGENQPQQQDQTRTVTPNDLNRMLEQIEEMMKRGDVAEAQRLLDELRQILENLQTAQPNNRMTDPMSREMSRSMEDLERMTREQQELRDETFRQGQNERMQRGQQGQRQQQQGQRGQQGQQQQGERGQQGQRQPGRQGQSGEEGQQGQRGQQGQGGQGLGERQQALRERLDELQRRMQGLGMQGEQGLADAEEAMREAEQAIQGGRDGQAVDAQGRALEGLRRGQQGMAQQMQQMQEGEGSEQAGQQPGEGQPQGPGRMGQRDNDPLGRPTRSRSFSDGRVKVPGADESASQRARRIMDELRRKLGDPNRAREELDYFDRLLRRN